MARTPSTMLPLGTPAPDFQLTNAVDGKTVSLADFEGKRGLLVMFICNHCPFVLHVLAELTFLTREYGACGVGIVAINSNSLETHPQDGPENMKQMAADLNWSFPFLFDENQSVAKAYKAACTPDFYLFDERHELVYRGQLDDSRPESDIPVTGADLRAAVDGLLTGDPIPEEQKPSLGCNIKWGAGNAPDYYG